MNIVYSASAGTGKTFQVTQHYLDKILNEQIDPRDILLITFTENAATELRTRISAYLHAALQQPKNGYKKLVFGKPNSDNFEFFFTAANFLKYSDSLKVVRAESGVLNATANTTGLLIRDTDHYLGSFSSGEASVGDFAARTAGTHGNSIGVSLCANTLAYEQHLGTNNLVNDSSTAIGDTTIVVDDVDLAGFSINVGDIIAFSGSDSSSDFFVSSISWIAFTRDST